MADRADFFLKNTLPGDIRVLTKIDNGPVVFDQVVLPGAQAKVVMNDINVSMSITALNRDDIKYCHFRVVSDVDLSVSCSRTHLTWTVRIVHNELPPDIPTTVNIEVGENPPM